MTDEALLERIRRMGREASPFGDPDVYFVKQWRKRRKACGKCECPACWLRREDMDKDFDASPCPQVWRVIKHGV